jgi:hypothetical protein
LSDASKPASAASTWIEFIEFAHSLDADPEALFAQLVD